MAPSSSITLLAMLAAFTVAQQRTTITMAQPAGQNTGLVASIIGVDAPTTTIAVACPSGAPDHECDMDPDVSATITAAPSSYNFRIAYDIPGLALTISNECDAVQSLPTACGMKAAGSQFGQEVLKDEKDADYEMVPVTVTAGIEKLK